MHQVVAVVAYKKPIAFILCCKVVLEPTSPFIYISEVFGLLGFHTYDALLGINCYLLDFILGFDKAFGEKEIIHWKFQGAFSWSSEKP